jgi:hypothetical protein
MQAINNKAPRRSQKVILSGLLVSLSVVGAWFFIESNKTTESFLVTTQDLASGEQLLLSQLSTKELSLFEITDRYLKQGELPEGSYLLRPVAAGEVIPLSAVTTWQLDDYSNVVLSPTVTLSAQIKPGTKVSIWSAKQLDYQSFEEPTLIALDVEVVSVSKPQGNFSNGSDLVELRVPLANVQYLLGAIANGAALALTATGQSLGN